MHVGRHRRYRRGRHARRILALPVAAAVGAAAVLALGGIAIVRMAPGSAGPLPDGSSTPAAAPPRPIGAATPAVDPSARPVRVSLPSIQVGSTLQRLTLDSHHVLQVPDSAAQAGWYTGGTVPGQVGPAVIAGHVDSQVGPGIFYRLHLLKPDDPVIITFDNGATVRFTVTTVAGYPKDAFPTAAVYGPTPAPELRLITCGGSFDRAAGSYVDNIVAYAVLR